MISQSRITDFQPNPKANGKNGAEPALSALIGHQGSLYPRWRMYDDTFACIQGTSVNNLVIAPESVDVRASGTEHSMQCSSVSSGPSYGISGVMDICRSRKPLGKLCRYLKCTCMCFRDRQFIFLIAFSICPFLSVVCECCSMSWSAHASQDSLVPRNFCKLEWID